MSSNENVKARKPPQRQDSFVLPGKRPEINETTTPFYSHHIDQELRLEDNKYLARESRSLTSRPSSPISNSPEGGSFTNEASNQTIAADTLPEEVTQELQELYTNFKKCLDIRDKYMKISCQQKGDNPNDSDDWVIYPPTPPPQPYRSSSHIIEGPGKVGENFVLADVPIPGPCDYLFKEDEKGIFQVYRTKEDQENDKPIVDIPCPKEYFVDLEYVLSISTDGPTKSFAYRRLKYLESKWNMYILLNEYKELSESKKVPHRDFYNVRKVDTHIHHSACMNQKHLLRFIKYKMNMGPQDVVIFRDGKNLTLEQVFQSLNLTAYDLNIDTLDMHAHNDSFHRFDKFNLKYNPVGESRLREIFMKTDNLIKGRYLAELTKEVISNLEQSKYQKAEYRISIYGRHESEWDKLADWVIENKLFSPNVRWLIQIPRLYSVYKASNTVQNFGQIISNIFKPLFEVTRDPSSHPNLHIFLQRVVGFDSVDDESKSDTHISRIFPYSGFWDSHQSPPYSYHIYYVFANMASLNNFRKLRGFNTFVLRPHCGEAGSTDHLTSAFLTSIGIAHGILLRKVPVLQYLFYLTQMGIAMSPLSNNALFLDYDRNPFPAFFHRGLNVSLSTDDPLQFHFTREPLMEEYSVAAQIWKLSPVDMCEISRSSVIQSGFENKVKKDWLGENWHLPGVEGNNMAKSNVPNIRIGFRHVTLQEELDMVRKYSGDCSVGIQPNNSIPIGKSQFLPCSSRSSYSMLHMEQGGLVDISDAELLQQHFGQTQTPAEAVAENAGSDINRQLGMLSCIAGVSIIAKRAAAKSREKARLDAEESPAKRPKTERDL
ncbi:AMP deaminase [Entomortierella beljakovae]|nr:AMP deaminase [Entomortierella beljakovae]